MLGVKVAVQILQVNDWLPTSIVPFRYDLHHPRPRVEILSSGREPDEPTSIGRRTCHCLIIVYDRSSIVSDVSAYGFYCCLVFGFDFPSDLPALL